MKISATALSLLLLMTPAVFAQQEEDVEAYCAEQMVSTYIQGRGGENVKFPNDPKFKGILEKSVNVSGYNACFSRELSVRSVPSKVVEKVPTDKNLVYLTFDDGPYAKGDGAQATTEELIDILEAKNVHATFFLQGMWSWKNKPILQRIVKQGSNIGNHTAHHPPDGWFMGPVQLGVKAKFGDLPSPWMEKEVLWGRAGIAYALSGHSQGITPYFRSPHGSGVVAYPTRPVKQEAIDAVARSGEVVINGNLLLSDARSDLSKAALIATYRKHFASGGPGQFKGEILWLHSGLRATADALPELIDIVRAHGYQVVALPQGLDKVAQADAPTPLHPMQLLCGLLRPFMAEVEQGPEPDLCPPDVPFHLH